MGRPGELFDLACDPGETHNRIDDVAYAPVVERLTAEIERYFARYEDEAKSGLRVRELPVTICPRPGGSSERPPKTDRYFSASPNTARASPRNSCTASHNSRVSR